MKRFVISLSDEEHALLSSEAGAAEVSMAEFVRSRVFGEKRREWAPVPPPSFPTVRRDLPDGRVEVRPYVGERRVADAARERGFPEAQDPHLESVPVEVPACAHKNTRPLSFGGRFCDDCSTRVPR